MKPIQTFTVVPALPEELEPLRELADNLRWSWDHAAIQLFRRVGGEDLWEETGRNPVALLGAVGQERLEELASDDGFLDELGRIHADLRSYLDARDTWFTSTHEDSAGDEIAYFSAEFGVTDCVSIFAGGLGMLAGDHLKSASDLGIPLVGVGLLYQQGYFAQRLNDAGWQQEIPATNDFHNLPISLERDEDGEPVTVELGFPEGPLVAQVWRVQVGRVSLYLLDANVPENSPEQRRVTHHLYGGDTEMRIRQEILLGIGGFRALEALGHEPSVYHMNEGHSAFLGLELIRRLMDRHKVTFSEAAEAAAAGLVFTTHTPVEAGHDYFDPGLVARYFEVYAKSLGLELPVFLALGRQDPEDEDERFCMTVLALKLAARANGVSRLHGEVTRRMWQNLWPGVPRHEIPVGHITNGVHLASWLSAEISDLYDQHLDGRWRHEPGDDELWDRLDAVDGGELWRRHEVRRGKLVEVVRARVRAQLERRGASPSEIDAVDHLLDPHALTIGFARRFATYKRATLFARDPDRLARILNDQERPVQLIVAGKAHPLDDAGKELIRQIHELSRDERFRGRIIFVEDYEMSLARYLVAGCDVWLNNPIRPREASGTSGMKASANGILNLSTLDGWWDEAWEDLAGEGSPPFGWAIGRGIVYDDPERQDVKEAEALYTLLERDVVPTFYDRGEDGVPWPWIARMRAAIEDLAPCFNTHRMLHEYVEKLYLPASLDATALRRDDLAPARSLAAWRERVTSSWGQVECELDPDNGAGDQHVRIGEQLKPRATVVLGDLTPDDVVVELYIGRVGVDGEIASGHALPMQLVESSNGEYVYEAIDVEATDSGRYGYTVRVRPQHPDLPMPFLPGCMSWAQDVA
ncbi:MAG: alpha-glucan family phosphorylase [Actinobacteria bacterium]|nr:alpha-glucan family phosphorylase [Actinomycetota bacterium]